MSVSDAAKSVVWGVLNEHCRDHDGEPVTISQALDFGLHRQVVRALDRARIIDGSAPEPPLHDRRAQRDPAEQLLRDIFGNDDGATS